ncbi:S-layer homology domain-containing protein [Ureibacillus composti]
MKFKIPVVVSSVLALSLAFSGGEKGYAFQDVNNTYPVSQGVNYSNYTYSNKTINHLKVNLANPYTKLKLSIPSPINSRMTLTQRANQDSAEGNRVVGAINANFFNMGDGYPMYLISQYNNIVSPEVISETKDYYVSEPIAFGITANGNAEIDYYDSDIIVNYKGESTEISGLNKTREANEGILYTPQHYSSITPTNEYGMEFIVETPETISATKFGQSFTGKVTGIRKYGDKANSKIPRNGFVLSFNGDALTKFKNVKVGEEISVSINIDNKWKDAQYIVASGPLLVYNGKVNVTMNTSSSRASQVTERTAIAIDDDKQTVHLVTVDGGITLSQFAKYLVNLGVDRALNFDGGGSTTMGIRKYGSNTVVLANNPAGGATQRKISAIIEAISTGATGAAKTMKISRDQVGTLLVGATVKLEPQYLLDEHYNPVSVRTEDFIITPQNNKVTVNGLSYTAVNAGSESLTIKNGNAAQTINFSIVDAPSTLSISSSSAKVEPNASMTFKATAKDASGNNLVYAPSQLKWSVEGDIGTISSSGVFKSNGKGGKGKVVATLGKKSVSKDIEVVVKEPEVVEKPMFTDIGNTHPYKEEISYLVERGIISGYPDGSFKPTKSLTRAHAAILLANALKLDTTNISNPEFTDVPSSHPYYRQIAAIENAGVMSGKGNNMFDPNGALTRAQMAAILVEAFDLTATTSTSFTDVKPSYWAFDDIQKLAASGITSGYPDGTFKPSVEVSRAHFSLFLYQALKK